MKKIISYLLIVMLFCSMFIIYSPETEAIDQHEVNNGTVIGNIDFSLLDDDDQGGNYNDVWCDESYIYVTCDDYGLRGYSFDGTNLTYINSIDNGDNYHGVYSDGTYIYTACDGSGIRAYTFDGASFTLAGSYSNSHYHWRLWGDGTYVYAAVYDDGVYAYSFDGTDFTLIDDADQGSFYYSVWGDGTYIYTASYTDGIRAYSFNGVTLTYITTRDDGGDYRGVWGNNTHVFAMCGYQGIRAYTFNGTGFTLEDTQDDGGYYRSVWCNGSVVYAATSINGIHMYYYADNNFLLLESKQGMSTCFDVHGNNSYLYAVCYNVGLRTYYQSDTFNITRTIGAVSEKNNFTYTPCRDYSGIIKLRIPLSTDVNGIFNVKNNSADINATEVNGTGDIINNTYWYNSANNYIFIGISNLKSSVFYNWTINCSYGADFYLQIPQYLEVGDYFMSSGLIKDNDSVPIDGFVAKTRILYQNGTDAIDPYHEWNCTNGNYWCVISTTSLPPGIYDISIEFTDASSGITFKEGSTLYLSWSPASGIYSDAVVFFNFYNTNEGLGLPRETLKIYVDNARQYDNSYYTYISDVINVTIKDYYNTTLYTNNFTISEAYTFLDLGLTFHSYKFCNKNEEYYMISLLKSGASRWWERGVCPYETIEYLIPSGTYTLRIYDADTVEIYNDSVSVVNSLVYVIEGTNLSEIISGQSIITGQLLELSTEIDYALMPDAYYYMANPTIIFSCFDSVGQKLGQNVWKVCPAKQLIATTRNETYSNWINSTALVPGNGSVANGTITIDEDILYLSGNGTISWVNITYTSNGTLMQNTTYIPNLIHLSGQDLTINASENINVQRETRFNQVKKFYWDIYNSSDNTGYLANRPGYHVATLEFENVLDVPLYDTYIFIGFSDKTSPDSNTVRVTDVSNDGVVLESGEDYRTSESGIDFKILGGMSASSTRTFTVEYYKEDHTEYVYDEGTIEAGYIERQKSFQDEFYNYFDFIWQNNRDKTFRGGILVKIAPSKIETEIIKGSVIIIDRDNSNQEIDDSQYVVGDTFIMISSEIVGDVTPGGGRSFGIYYQEEQYPGSNPREFHLNTPIGRFLLIMWTPFLLIVVFPLLLMAVGIYLAIREGKLKDSYKALIAVGLVVTVLFWILQAKGV